MKKLLVILAVIIASCSNPTSSDNCAPYTLQEHNYYNEEGYSVFVSESDSIGVELNEDEVSNYKVGNTYTLCFNGEGNVTIIR